MSIENLSRLVSSYEPANPYAGQLEAFREEVGCVKCLEQLLAVFSRESSPSLCKQAWRVAVDICLTDDEPAMSSIEWESWKRAILHAARNPAADVRIAALSIVSTSFAEADLSDDVVELLISGLASNSERVRQMSAHVLGKCPSRVLPRLLLNLESTATELQASRLNGYTSAWYTLFALDSVFSLSDLDPEVRSSAASVIVKFVDQYPVMNSDEYLDVWKAGDTLGNTLQGDAGLHALVELASHQSSWVRRSAAHGLGHIGGPVAEAELVRLLHDNNLEVREEARTALTPLRRHPE